MTYEKRPDIALPTGEVALQLDDGNLVAAQCRVSRDPQSNNSIFATSARWVDAEGAQRIDASGRAVATAKTHSASTEQVVELTVNSIVRECLFLVLGEPLTPDPEHPEINVMKFSADNIAQCSIRNAIASASVAAPNASDVL